MKQLQHNKRPKGHTGKAEAKIFFIVCYYVLVGTVTLTTYTYFITTDDETMEAFQEYFTCQSVGMQSDRDCGDPPDVRLRVFYTLASVAGILQGLLPLVILIFVMNCSCYKRCYKIVKTSKRHISELSFSTNI